MKGSRLGTESFNPEEREGNKYGDIELRRENFCLLITAESPHHVHFVLE
ncbi:MAG TPA: hypothetical protein VFS84_02495 [Candidatus Binatia bacterium]|nr:hypothetical protein [Candidatus Binatia bacterium]